MKLLIHDQKHQKINDELELNIITTHERKLIENIIKFLDKNQITNRYASLVLAENYDIIYEDGEPIEIQFDPQSITKN